MYFLLLILYAVAHNLPLCTEDMPTFPLLIRFPTTVKPINILTQLSTNYVQFGTLLLEDTSGARIIALENEYRANAERINYAIIQRWFEGSGQQPVTWTTLTRVLNDIGQVSLAEQITKSLHP